MEADPSKKATVIRPPEPWRLTPGTRRPRRLETEGVGEGLVILKEAEGEGEVLVDGEAVAEGDADGVMDGEAEIEPE